MKKIKLLLVANNLKNWDTWDTKMKGLYLWAEKAGIDLEISLRHSNFSKIPFIDYGYKGDPYDKGIIMGNNLYGVDPVWYDENVSVLGIGSDVVCFVIPPKQWKGAKSAGWRYDRTLGPIELQVNATGELESYQVSGKSYLKFFLYLKHELSHAFYEIAGQPDRTHEFYYSGDWYCEKAIANIKWPKPNYASDDPKWWEGFLNLIAFLRKTNVDNTKLDKFCQAIQKHEGWYPESRSWRNNNPGNIKYLGQIKSVGADKNGFAIFENYQDGYETLKSMITRACQGLSKVYRPTDSIVDFFNKYAPPSDNNDSLRYAQVVAEAVGVGVDYQIKDLIQ